MNHKLIIQQIKMESEALGHVTRALDVATAWAVEGDDLSRKLSSVRFATELFQRQVERLFALEELDGDLERAVPFQGWADRVDDFKRDHEQIRTLIRKLVLRLDRASTTDRAKLEGMCEELRAVIQQTLEHNRRESDLLSESMLRDTGGQG